MTAFETGQAFGSLNGGDHLTLGGASFASATVTVGGSACSIQSQSTTAIQCVSPSGSLGSADVVVTNTGGLSATLTAGYTFVAVSQVSISDDHGCAVLSNGALYCWGGNSLGQLGDGSQTNQLNPVVALIAGAAQVAASSGGHTCAVLTNGAVECWGNNNWGQLGNDSTSNFIDGASSPSVPQPIASGAVTVATGNEHTCEVSETGAMWCWGLNSNGAALADSNVTSMQVTPGMALASAVTSISTNLFTSCAAQNGAYVCWGGGGSGQLGTGATTDYKVGGVASAPAAFPTSSGVITGGVTAGTSDDNCAIVPATGLECWGVNGNQEILGSSASPQATPILVASNAVATFASVAMGEGHICGVTTGGALYCWGTNSQGQLGTGTTTAQTSTIGSPVISSNVTEVSTSQSSTCAIWNGDLFCWGGNSNGQYGNGGGVLLSPSRRVFP